MKALLVATAFLTRVPIPVEADAADVGRAARWFPLVGAALGGAGALLARGLDDLTSVPPALCAVLLVGLAAWVTGAIHLDGLADMADGFGGGRSREDVLRIMRDPVIGSFGAITLMLVMAAKIEALTTLLDRQTALPVLVAAPTLSRWTIVALGAWLPYARPEGGLGEAVTSRHEPAGFLWATVVTAGITMAALQIFGLVLWLLAGLVAVSLGRLASRRIGGVTGDVFGASVELAETTVLVGGAILASRP